jgi:O-antigen ligase
MTFASHVLRWIFVLSALGYAIVALTALSIGAESRPFAVGLRVSIALISGIALLMFAKGSISIRPPVLLLAFLFLYMCRLMWDIQTIESAKDNLQFYIVVVIIPTIAVVILSRYWQDFGTAKMFAFVGMFGSAILILASVLGLAEWRSTTINTGGRVSYDVLDPISVGNLGAATAIAGFCVYRITRARWALAPVAVGIVCLAMGLSRGPILSLLGCVGVYLWLTGRFWVVFVALIPATAIFSTDYGEAIFKALRIGDFQSDVTTNIRLDLISSSINQYLESPIFGSSHVDKVSGSYPHNIFVEAALSTGVLGLFLVVFVFIKAWQSGVRRARSGDIFLFLTLVYWMIEVQVSGSIWSNAMLWLSMALVLSSRNPVKLSGRAGFSVTQLRAKSMSADRGAFTS